MIRLNVCMHIIFRIIEEIRQCLSISLRSVFCGIEMNKVIQDIIKMGNAQMIKNVKNAMAGMN